MEDVNIPRLRATTASHAIPPSHESSNLSDALQGPVYLTETWDELVDTEVRTRPFCSMLMMVALAGFAVPLDVPADTPVNVTVPQLERGTRPPPSEKSSTIHSAFSWQSAGWPLKVCDTVWPVEWLTIVAVPPVSDVAVTETVIEFPALSVMPEKSCAKSGNHSNQAARVLS